MGQHDNTKKKVWHDVGVTSYTFDRQKRKTFFINVAGLLYDAHVVKKASSKPSVGALGYISIALKELIHYAPEAVVVESDDHSFKGKAYTIHAGICPFSGSGMCFVPHAKHDSGSLAITVVSDMPKVKLLLHLYRLFTKQILGLKKARGFKTTSIKIQGTSAKPVWIEADGELLGEGPIQIDIIPKALQIIIP